MRVLTPAHILPSVTDQSHGDQTDINRVIERYKRTGVMPQGNGPGHYADVTSLQGDFAERLAWAEGLLGDAQSALENLRAEREAAQAKPGEPDPAPPTPNPDDNQE